MRKYESTITFRFKEENWIKAQKANHELLKVLGKLFPKLVVDIQCKKLKKYGDDAE